MSREVKTMNKFENFLKQVLTVIFREMPFNRQKADESLEKIKMVQKATLGENKDGHNK